eukprot:gene9177-6603_t
MEPSPNLKVSRLFIRVLQLASCGDLLQLFLEKCQAVHGKNFLFGSPSVTNQLALQIYGKLEGNFEKLLSSVPLECGTCPSWTVYGLRSVAELRRHLEDTELLVKVVGAAGDRDETTFFEEVFRLDELFVIETSNRSLYPPNFICFQFNGVRCTSLRLAQIFGRLAGAAAAPTRFALDLDDDARPSRETTPLPPKPLAAIQERLDKLHAFAAVEERLVDALDERLVAATLVRRDTLQAALAVETERVRRRGEENVSGARTIPGSRLETLMQATETMARSIRRLQALSQEKQRQHVQLKFFLEARQQKLFQDILVVYPITQGKSGEYSIRGIELPYDFSAVKDDETLSSGVGYLVHVLLMLSKYWEIPLRYQLLFHGSRCLVRDLAATNAILPLFRSYNDKERFDRAVSWLRVDLEQLLQTRGVTFDPSRSLLANLVQLAQCDVCPSLAY